MRKNQQLTISNFAEVWIEADDRLEDNIQNLRKDIEELELTKQDYI